MIRNLNNKGQALVLFVLILPLLIMLGALVIDMGYLNNAKTSLDNINKIALNYYLDNASSKEEIMNLIKKNDDKIENIYLDLENNTCITLEKKVNSLLGNIFGFKTYDISSSYCALVKDGNKKIYQKGK